MITESNNLLGFTLKDCFVVFPLFSCSRAPTLSLPFLLRWIPFLYKRTELPEHCQLCRQKSQTPSGKNPESHFDSIIFTKILLIVFGMWEYTDDSSTNALRAASINWQICEWADAYVPLFLHEYLLLESIIIRLVFCGRGLLKDSPYQPI